MTSQPDTAAQPAPDDGVYALLIDGTTVLVRPARPDDEDAVRQMHAEMSPANVYLRFFSISPLAAEREAKRVCRPPDHDHAALLAWLGSQLVGVASYEPTGKPGVAEIAFAVSDHMHGRGIATLLLDHLVSIARLRGLEAFTAETLADNIAMLRVFANAGLPVRRQMSDGVIETTFPLPADEADRQLQGYLDSVAKREQLADVASLRHLLEPSSVAVVGASRKPGRVGHAILRNILAGGFAGRVYPVNPRAKSVEGVACLPSVADLPEPVDLAVVAVPSAAVAQVARECGHRGVRSLVVVTSGLEADIGSELLATCRSFGMRLVGPNCFGIAIPGLNLNATFAAANSPPGVAGLVVQSGGIGIAVLEHLARLGIGVSSFASVGDKYDVSSNDMLMWWEKDRTTRLAVLYVESFGSPRRFAQTARRVGRQMPVLTVMGGRSPAGQRAAASHTAAAATPLITQEALFEQAGIVATTTLGELIDVAALLASQPLPAGNRVAIVSNAGGAGVLAADACGDNGLQVAVMSAPTQQRLRRILPSGAAVAGPVDTTAAVSQRTFRTCLEKVARDDGVDAVLVITVPTAVSDLTPAILQAKVTKPLLATMLDQHESVRLLHRQSGQLRSAASPDPVSTDETSTDETSTDETSAEPTSTGLASTGLASTGLASTGLASSGLASSGLASTGLASTGLASSGLASTDADGPGWARRAAASHAAGNGTTTSTSGARPSPVSAIAATAAGAGSAAALAAGTAASTAATLSLLDQSIPAYLYPESAARALGYAVRYSNWRSRTAGQVPDLTGIRQHDAHVLVARFLTGQHLGGWLPPAETAELLSCYGISLTPTREVTDAAAAAAAAAELGGQVVLKADVAGLVHKSEAGAVLLGLHTRADVRNGYAELAERFGADLRRVLVQPMIADGVEVLVGVVHEPVFGPLVVFGLGGVATDVLGDHTARLTPVTDTDADELIHGIRAAPLLLGHRGTPPVDVSALADLLLRVSRLADEIPEVAELDLNPVIARQDGAFPVDARIRLVPAEPQDPFLRRLR